MWRSHGEFPSLALRRQIRALVITPPWCEPRVCELNASTFLPKAGTAQKRGKSNFLRSMHRKSTSGRWEGGCWGAACPRCPPATCALGSLCSIPSSPSCKDQMCCLVLSSCNGGVGKLQNTTGKWSVEVVSLSHAAQARSITGLFAWLILFFFCAQLSLQPPRSAVWGQAQTLSI